MRRALLVVLFAVLAFGAVLDGTVHRLWAGMQTIGQERSSAAAVSGDARDTTVLTLVGSATESGPVDGRYSVYLAMRRAAPGAQVVVDPTVLAIEDHFIKTIGAAALVRREAPSDDVYASIDAVLRSRQPEEAGRFRHGPWELRVAPGTVGRLLVVHDGTTTQLIDARLAQEAAAEVPPPPAAVEATSARPAEEPPTLVRAATVETAMLVLLVVLGGLLLPRDRSGPVERTALALLIGLALLGTSGLLFLPGLWGLALVSAASIGAALIARRRNVRVGWGHGERWVLAAAIAAIGAVVTWSRWFPFVLVTADSHEYLAGGAALADGAFGPSSVSIKRGVAQQALHAPGFALGVEGLQAVGTVALVATLVLLVATLQRIAGRPRLIAAALLGLAVVASPQVRALAAYVNSHVLVAASLVALVVLLAAEGIEQERQLLPAVVLLSSAVVLSRAEGPLLVVLLLLGTLAIRGDRLRWIGAWRALGVLVLAWFAVLQAGQSGSSPALVLLAVIGVLSLLVPDLLRKLTPAWRQRVPFATGVVLWVITGALLLLSAVGLAGVGFLDAAVGNLGRGAGGWGVFGIGVLILAIVVIALGDEGDPRLAPGRWLLIGFVPVTLLTKLGDRTQSSDARWVDLLSGGGRVSWADSVNRMWMHVVLVVLLLLVLRFRSDSDGPEELAPTASSRARPRPRPVMLGLLALTAIWVALQWQPDHLPRVTDERVTLERTEGGRPAGELVDGAEVRQVILAPSGKLPEGVAMTGTCVALRFVTFARGNTGHVELSLSDGDATVTRRIDAAEIDDWSWQEVCLDQSADASAPGGSGGPLSVTVSGVDGRAGAAVSVLADGPSVAGSAAGPGAVATLPDAQGRLVTRSVGPLDAEITLRYEPRTAIISRTIDRVALFLPWLLVGFGGALVGVDRRATRTLRTDRRVSVPS